MSSMKKTRSAPSFVPIFKVGGIALGVLVVALALASLVAGAYQTRKMERDPRHAQFLAGKLPKPPPQGFMKGNQFTGFGKNWQGKVFTLGHLATGINQFSDGQRYPFKVEATDGLRDQGTAVLRINYNQPDNPWWLRFVVDEIVQTSPGHYLGKIHVQVIPGLPFTIGYFELSAQ